MNLSQNVGSLAGFQKEQDSFFWAACTTSNSGFMNPFRENAHLGAMLKLSHLEVHSYRHTLLVSVLRSPITYGANNWCQKNRYKEHIMINGPASE